MLYCVPPSEMALWWPQAAPILQRVIDRGHTGWTVQAALRALVAGEAHLWLAVDEDGAVEAAQLTTVSGYPDGSRRLTLDLGGGELEAMRKALPAIEAWARGEGIGMVQIVNGRPGWGRVLGYAETGRTFVKDLRDG